MRLLCLFIALVVPSMAFAQIPITSPQLPTALGPGGSLKVEASATTPVSNCIVSFGGSQCITIPDAVVADFDTDVGDTANIELIGLALPSSSGPVRVDGNTPLPVILTTASTSAVVGNVGHDSPASGNPLTLGFTAIAHGTNPTAVTAADVTRAYANRAGVPFVIGGHPNVFTYEAQVQDADGAQTDLAIVTCGSGCKVVVTEASITCDPDTTDDTAFRMGFGATVVPAGAHTGVAGVVLAMDGVTPGGGRIRGDGSGIIGIGADGEDLRFTIGDPAGGSCNMFASGYTIDS